MSFPKMTPKKYPPRLWLLEGYPNSGKTTFAVQMRGPLLVIDADHRFDEVLRTAGEREVFALSQVPADNVDPDRIVSILGQNMPGARIGTIIVDSLTPIISPLVVQAMIDNNAGREKNLVAAFRTKALAMRQVQDGVTRWGTDALWIYHLIDARDEKARALTRASIPPTELARLIRSVNLRVRIIENDGKRGVKVVWARRGRSEIELWDDAGLWGGMPEKIEAAVYDGLTRADQEQIAQATPEIFPDAETAIAWGYERGAFKALQHARNAYNKLKCEAQPESAREMASLWAADVQTRLERIAEGADPDEEVENEVSATPVAAPPSAPASLPLPADEPAAPVAEEPVPQEDDLLPRARAELGAQIAPPPPTDDPAAVLDHWFPRESNDQPALQAVPPAPSSSSPNLPAWAMELRAKAQRGNGASDPISPEAARGLVLGLARKGNYERERIRTFLRILWTCEPEELTKSMYNLTATLLNDHLDERIAELEK